MSKRILCLPLKFKILQPGHICSGLRVQPHGPPQWFLPLATVYRMLLSSCCMPVARRQVKWDCTIGAS